MLMHTLANAIPLAPGEYGRFFVGWGTLALINAGLAQGKGHGGLAWFLLSLVLGPIATFCIVALCERRATPAR